MKKINVIKFVPYFPPHKGGLESHVQEHNNWRVRRGYGDIICITTSVGQRRSDTWKNPISHGSKIIGYEKDG